MTSKQCRQLRLVNNPGKPVIDVSYAAFGLFDAGSVLRQIIVRDNELVLELEKVSARIVLHCKNLSEPHQSYADMMLIVCSLLLCR